MKYGCLVVCVLAGRVDLAGGGSCLSEVGIDANKIFPLFRPHW